MNTTGRNLVLLAACAAASSARLAVADDPPPAPAPSAPAEAKGKHECKVAPEAQAAFDRIAKAVNGPFQRGMKEASGVLTADVMGNPVTMKFTVKAPAAVTVDPDPNLKGPQEMMGRNIARNSQSLLRSAFGVFRPAENDFDAEVVKKDGKDVLSISIYKDGAEQSHSDITLDADGLPASVATHRAAPQGKGPGPSETTYTWSKSGDSRRLDKLETSGGPAGAQRTNTITIAYEDVGGFQMPVSWKMTNARGSSETRLTEITVDGKKVELKPSKPADTRPAPTGGDDKK